MVWAWWPWAALWPRGTAPQGLSVFRVLGAALFWDSEMSGAQQMQGLWRGEMGACAPWLFTLYGLFPAFHPGQPDSSLPYCETHGMLKFWVWTKRDGDGKWTPWAHEAMRDGHPETPTPLLDCSKQSSSSLVAIPPTPPKCVRKHPLFPAVSCLFFPEATPLQQMGPQGCWGDVFVPLAFSRCSWGKCACLFFKYYILRKADFNYLTRFRRTPSST